MNKDLITLIGEMMGGFSKGQRMIADYIINHYDKAAFMTASRLGSTVGVSESTVVRFASEVGYEGYPQLQRALQELIRNRLTAVQRMEVTTEQIGGSDVLSKVLGSDIENIRRTLEESSTQTFNNAVDALCNARTIYILGIRSSSALSRFLYFYFNHILDDVRLINTNSSSEMFEQILRIGPQDVFIGITFPRYSQRTYNGAKFATDSGAKVIAITDSPQSPIASISDTVLLARSDMASFVDSLVAPLSLINALIVAVGLRKKNEISATFSRLERIWDEYNVYEKIEGTHDIDVTKI
ncbi:MurR/RpiR family transcriptional regulator [Clostridiaceae bacterium NSJ-31]|uniref:MurR/RpiR family transcriptional regulator n=1 Tax=Ligaoa zhengdingensis TaxID=2763658 RepID=A0A926DWI9_9FIRM|nr:MurR/RpiR family transcriptional regulator [Ligaoa zhengdingensis]MBC8545381.1 MurR/RpiR family transcriptional regulator [Ligaoa zhengdingensis]